jgi:hypothetical protein
MELLIQLQSEAVAVILHKAVRLHLIQYQEQAAGRAALQDQEKTVVLVAAEVKILQVLQEQEMREVSLLVKVIMEEQEILLEEELLAAVAEEEPLVAALHLQVQLLVEQVGLVQHQIFQDQV